MDGAICPWVSHCPWRSFPLPLAIVTNPDSSTVETTGHLPTSALRSFGVLLVLLCGIALSVAAYYFVQAEERSRVSQQFKWQARMEAQSLAMTIKDFEECLYTLRNLFTASDYVRADEFEDTAADLRTRHPGIQLLEWMPVVPHPKRAEFEATARQSVNAAFVIHNGRHEGNDDNRAVLPAEEQATYLPIHYASPAAGNEMDLGFDQFRGLHQRAIARAIESGEMTATHRVQFHDGPGDHFGWVMLLPIFDSLGTPATPEKRRSHLRGFVAGAFRFSELVAGQARATSDTGVELLLTDETPAGSEPYLVSFTGSGMGTAPPPSAADFSGEHALHLPLLTRSRDWVVHFRPDPIWLARQTTMYRWGALVGGFWLTGLLATLLHNAQERTRNIERLVRDRTTELAATQEELRSDIMQREAAEERYRAFVAHSTEGIWRYEFDSPLSLALPEDAQLDHIYAHAFLAECNDASARMYGFDTATEMLGTRIATLMPRADERNTHHFQNCIRARFRTTDSESREVDRHGRERIFLNNIIGIIEDELLVRVWGTHRDITGLRAAETARRENEARLRLALASADMGTWEWDIKADVVSWSEGLYNIFGLDAANFGATYSAYLERIHPDDRERIRSRVMAAVENGKDFEIDYRIVRPDGTERWLVTRGEVWRDEKEEAIRLLGAAVDITERKRQEEERTEIDRRLQETQKLESLGILAGGIAHDFNNLLTGILGNASLVRMDLPPHSPFHPYLQAIETTSHRAADLCKQMLAYSGKGRFVVAQLDISAIVEETAHLLRLSISKDAVINFNLGRDLPAVSADATQIRQIVMNLVINASDALGDQGGVINIGTGLIHADRGYLADTHLAPELPEGDYVYIEVTDNGCGMSPETRDRIFDPFFTTKFTGRGLGLAAVLGIVRGHRGTLKVQSEIGCGTTFKLLLPASSSPAEPDPKIDEVQDWMGDGDVLVVDDEATVRAVAGRMLEAFGFNAVLVSRGAQAVQVFNEDPARFVAVLLDLTMPQMDGNETFAALRLIKPDVKVLLISGFGEQEATNRFAGKGLAGFLQKPFTPEGLRDKLRAILGGSA